MTPARKLLTASALGLGAAMAARSIQRRAHRIDFRDRVVVITGGSRGLGLVMARQLAAQGARLALLARDADELDRAAKDIAARGAEVLAVPCDVTKRQDVGRAIEAVVQRMERIDVLINNAGIIQVGPLGNMTIEDFEQAMATHLWGPLYTTLACLPHLRLRGGGRIVNISSIGGQVSVPHLLPYSTSKFALVGLSEGLRAELARENILVTTVCPGLMRTGSHGNAMFKGQRSREFAWFALFDALPITSIGAGRAAAQVLDACRHGDARLTITVQARLAVAMNALFPNFTATMMSLATRLLPGPVDGGEQAKRGWESPSPLVPSFLTRLSDQAASENNELPQTLGIDLRPQP